MNKSIEHQNVSWDNNLNQLKTYDNLAYTGDIFPIDNWNTFYGYYHYYPYPVYEQSKLEQAFKIVAKLLEMKLIQELSVVKFIELVNEIANII